MKKKITSLRTLAIMIDKEPVNCEIIGKGLNKRIDLWLSRNEVFIKNGMLHLTSKSAKDG